MKKFYLFALLLLPFALTAQKSVDLDRYKFSVQYRSLPRLKIDSTYRTYNVEVQGTRLMDNFLQDMSPEKSVRIEGWRKLREDGHLDIKVKLGDLLPESVSVKERAESIKDRNGVITGTRIYYRQEVIYSFEATATITDYKGMHIRDQELADRRYKKVYRSPEFTLRPLAEGYFVVNSLAVTKDLFRESVNDAMHTLSEVLTEDFGFSAVTANDYMWIIDTRKHPEYGDWRKAFQQLNEVLFDMDASTPIDEAAEKLKPVITYFNKIKQNYSSTNRHDRKLRYAAYFNLAVLYYYLDDPQAMMKEANGLVLNDFDANDGKAFERTATWLRNLFQQNNIYTRHFPMDTESLKGPFEKEEVTIK